MVNSNSNSIDPINLRIIIVGLGAALILSLIYILEPEPTTSSASRQYDVVFEIISPNAETDWLTLKSVFSNPFSDGSISANISEESVMFNDDFYDTVGGDLRNYGYEIRFRSVVDANGNRTRSRLDLIHVSRSEEYKNSLDLTIINLVLTDTTNVPPTSGETLAESINSSSRRELISKLREIGVMELNQLQPVLTVVQKRKRLKFSEDQTEILSVAMDDSLMIRGERKVPDVRITIQPNSRALNNATDETFNKQLEYARNVIRKISEKFFNLRLTRERLTETFFRKLKEQRS